MDELLQIEGLTVDFLSASGLWGRRRKALRAVDGVTLTISENETLGLVGESGSGKSTMGRASLRLVRPTSGRILFEGVDITRLPEKQLRRVRRNMQIIFQDPYSSLDPSMLVEDLVGEALDIHERLPDEKRRTRIEAALDEVGLDRHHLERYSYEFSGGQRQRIAIAAAIILRPKLVVCDEPVSALDVSTQSQIINLLSDLQHDLGLSYLFIAHDLAVVRHISHRIAVMYMGQIVESGPSRRVSERPAHPYTFALLSAILYPHPRVQRERNRIVLSGDIPSPLDPPPGCRFHTRCPFAMDICRNVAPANTPVIGGGEVACHLHTEGPQLAGASIFDLQPERFRDVVEGHGAADE